MSDVKEEVKNKLKNLLKHNYPFTMIDDFIDYEDYNTGVETLCFIYETEEIPNSDAINAKTVNDMHNILKPTIEYFKSLNCYTERSDYFNYSYGISIKFFKENGLLENIGLLHLFYDEEGCIMDHYTFCNEESFQKYKKIPFIIQLKFLYHYERDEQEHESENEDEDEQEHENENEDDEIINYQQTFKSNECVICLTNPPNVLFCNCGHICICKECKELKTFSTCPVCKTENNIIRKLDKIFFFILFSKLFKTFCKMCVVKYKVKNLFKNKYPFRREFREVYKGELNIVYETQNTLTAKALNLKTFHDIGNMVKPTIKYFKSLKLYKEKIDYVEYNYQILIRFEEQIEFLDFVEIVNVSDNRKDGYNFRYIEYDYINFEEYKDKPFFIRIELSYPEKYNMQEEKEGITHVSPGYEIVANVVPFSIPD